MLSDGTARSGYPRDVVQLFVDFVVLRDSLGAEVSKLWSDVFEFMKELQPGRRISATRRQRLMRSAVFCAAAAFEAMTNFLSDQIASTGEIDGRKLTEAERDYLQERRKVLEGGRIRDEKRIYRSKDRFLLLYSILGKGRVLPSGIRAGLDKSFATRDELTHPKPGASLDLVRSGKGADAVIGFLSGDLFLARAWAGEGQGARTPRVPSGITVNGVSVGR